MLILSWDALVTVTTVAASSSLPLFTFAPNEMKWYHHPYPYDMPPSAGTKCTPKKPSPCDTSLYRTPPPPATTPPLLTMITPLPSFRASSFDLRINEIRASCKMILCVSCYRFMNRSFLRRKKFPWRWYDDNDVWSLMQGTKEPFDLTLRECRRVVVEVEVGS